MYLKVRITKSFVNNIAEWRLPEWYFTELKHREKTPRIVDKTTRNERHIIILIIGFIDINIGVISFNNVDNSKHCWYGFNCSICFANLTLLA